MQIRWVVVGALVGALLVGCAAPAVQRVPGDAEPVGLAPIEPVAREQRGATVWAVALAVSDQGPDDAKLRLAAPDGFEATVVDVDCDPGARDGLQLKPRPYWYAAVYLASQEAGFRFKERYGLAVVGIVAVRPVSGCS